MAQNEASATIADLVRAHLEENRETLAKQAVTQAVADLTAALKWKVEHDVNEQLGAFYKAEISPRVMKYLEEHREDIASAVIGTLAANVQLVADKLAEDMVKRMGDEWQRRSIIKALFGVG